MAFDKAILKPVAKGYNKLPDPVKKGTSNFTSNIATLLSVPNHLLQGELNSALNASGSFLINTTIRRTCGIYFIYFNINIVTVVIT